MTIQVRRSAERGHADHGWLDARHTFSFAGYFDPEFVQFGTLRVLNEDRVAPGQGFGAHPHESMEIITVVLEGGLQHKDSLGSGSVIRPGDVQVMSAGRGVVHSEFNASQDEPVHLVQIWILPDAPGGDPRYDEAHWDEAAFGDGPVLIASGGGEAGALAIGTDARLFRAKPSSGESHVVALDRPGRCAWVQVLAGSVRLGDEVLEAGDGAALTDVDTLEVVGDAAASDVLVFDLPVVQDRTRPTSSST